ncbi:uncharacterized protein AB675_7667 [Cyphellophora attinorum]|uniref:2EXR domain-containing protein n=1 Tax=Cyphellophora attinorum TaxID=1664694 RepID=A0A0N1H4N8_9EURO|nr:uncharacterized protein AB675_7667 [Phialophora attinorum]KPI40297.1 hypothetical protein AB675_7667 [Phialophora attinorum]
MVLTRAAAQRGANADTIVDEQTSESEKPFRFLDLPTEIRQMVYELHFVGVRHLAVDVPGHLVQSTMPNIFAAKQHKIPPLLLACRTIRAEAMPVFSSKLTVHIHRGLGRNTRHRQARASTALAHYLCSSTALVIHGFDRVPYPGKLELPSMPALKVLRFFVYNNGIGQASVFRDHAVHVQWFRETGMLALRQGGSVEPGVRVFAELNGKCAYLGRIGSV